MDKKEALKLAETRARGLKEEPEETPNSFIFSFPDSEEIEDNPLIVVNKKTRKVEILDFLRLSDEDREYLMEQD